MEDYYYNEANLLNQVLRENSISNESFRQSLSHELENNNIDQSLDSEEPMELDFDNSTGPDSLLDTEEDLDEDIWKQFEQSKDLTEREIYIMMLLLQRRHSMTDAAVVDWARFLNLLFKEKKLNISFKTICKKSRLFHPKVEKRFYLDTPCEITEGVTNLQQIAKCETPNCKHDCKIFPAEAIRKPSSHYVYAPLFEWCSFLFPLLYDKFTFDHKPDCENIHDITDGNEYKRLQIRANEIKALNGDLDSKNITLALGYDGASYNNTNSQSAWPLVAYILELPLNIRQNNGLLLALHAGPGKPSNLIFKPLIDELIKYDKTPMEIQINGRTEKFYVRLLLTIADAPARADLLNCKQFNSVFGCNQCYVMAEYVSDHKTHRYPMTCKGYRLRTNDEWRQQIALSKRPEIDPAFLFGIKGDCQLSRLEYVHLNKIAPSEFMHSILLGVVKLVVDAWIGKVEHVPRHLTQAQINLVNSRLETIKFPCNQLRKMPTLGSKDKWKAFDYEIFLCYGYLSLQNVLPKAYFENFLKLTKIITTLNKRNISLTNDIQPTRILIADFISEFGRIYPQRMHRFNVHALSHFPDMVSNFGPLYNMSSFALENSMGIFVHMIETGTNVSQQLMNKALIAASIFAIFNSTNCELSLVVQNFAALVHPKLGVSIKKGVILQRKQSRESLNEKDKQALRRYADQFDSAKFYSRLVSDKFTITTTAHNLGGNQTSNCFLKSNDHFYRIIKIIKFPSEFIILGLKYSPVSSYSNNPYYITNVKSSSTLEILSLESVHSICTPFYDDNNLMYAMEIINRHN